jgi:hypothetical protein
VLPEVLLVAAFHLLPACQRRDFEEIKQRAAARQRRSRCSASFGLEPMDRRQAGQRRSMASKVYATMVLSLGLLVLSLPYGLCPSDRWVCPWGYLS